MAEIAVKGFKVEIVPATASASRILRKIEDGSHDASNADPIGPLLWPKQQAEQQEVSTATDHPAEEGKSTPEPEEDPEIAREVEFLQDPTNFYQWVIDSEVNEPVGYVWWQNMKGRSPKEWDDAWSTRYRPPEMNAGLMDATSGRRFLRRAELLKDREAFILRELYILHAYQRRGLGAWLVGAGAQQADALSLQSYTEASPAGLKLYLRHGFEEVDRITVDLEPWGGEPGDINSYGLLLRQPTNS